MYLNELLVSRKMTTTQLSEQSGIARSTLVKLQAGVTKPSWDTIERLRTVFGSEINNLEWGTKQPGLKRGRPVTKS